MHIEIGGNLSDYYTRNILREIRTAGDYIDLRLIGMAILRNMAHEHPFRPIVMVCGPISTGGKGSRAENLKVFARAIDKISADGLFVFSQIPFEDDMERIYKSKPELQRMQLLEEFYLPMFKSGLIKLLCFLPGWDKSVGATWEHDQAKILNIPRIYLADSYIAN